MTSQTRTKQQPELSLAITRLFDAPRALVYRMWSENHLMQRWSCPEGYTIPSAAADFRVGGKWHAHMRSPEGEDMKLEGIYREIVKNERLVFTHAWLDSDGKPGVETLVTVIFRDENGKTRMDFMQTGFESAGSRDGHEGGWMQCFDKLGNLIDAVKAAPNEINIARLIDAPIARVYKAFSDPRGLAVWWGPNGFTTTTHKHDFRVGGVWEYTMHGPGGTDYPNYVTYTEIRDPNLIRYDHGTDAQHPNMFKAVIRFDAEGTKTRVRLQLILRDPKQREDMVAFGAVEGGWQNLARLDKYLADQTSKASQP